MAGGPRGLVDPGVLGPLDSIEEFGSKYEELGGVNSVSQMCLPRLSFPVT